MVPFRWAVGVATSDNCTLVPAANVAVTMLGFNVIAGAGVPPPPPNEAEQPDYDGGPGTRVPRTDYNLMNLLKINGGADGTRKSPPDVRATGASGHRRHHVQMETAGRGRASSLHRERLGVRIPSAFHHSPRLR